MLRLHRCRNEGITVHPIRESHTESENDERALEICVVSKSEDDPTYAAVCDVSGTVRNIICDWRDLALGVHEMLGDSSDQSGTWIPVRDPSTKSIRREQIDPVDVALYGETIEIVPAGLAIYQQDNTDVSDFLKGNTITWRELDLHLDVDRDITKGATGALQRVRTMLAASPTDSFAIEHTPGAGGTTVARRLAWDLRDEYPCIILKSFTENTPDFLEAIFQRSNLPLFIVAEASRLPGIQRDSFFNVLKGRSLRFVILDVRRRHTPRHTEASVAVTDPMSAAEAQRFLSRYEPMAPKECRDALRKLATRDEFVSFRSPFFFGLYAFEHDFVRVPDFIQHLLEGLSEKALRVIAELALIRRYSQEALPAVALRVLLGLPSRSDDRKVHEILGSALSRIIMFDGKNVGLAHPLLAREILHQYLQPAGAELPEAWRTNLSAFCIQFIQEMAGEGLRESAAVEDILSDLFIERGFRQDSTAPQQFSDLLNELKMVESQRLILEALCEYFPENAHFWSHLGRHMSICGTGTFDEAVTNLWKAIDIEPGEEVHRHALGMVYRKEVQRRLQNPLFESETAANKLAEIKPIFTKAEECFAKARELNHDSKYPVVSPIQMILDTFERLARLNGPYDRYDVFLSSLDPVAEWCRSKLVIAQDLLSILHQLEANSDPGQYRLTCDSRLQGVLGDFEGMVQGFTQLLTRPDIAHVPVRRMLARVYMDRIDSDATPPKNKTLRRIVELMEENLADNPSSGHDIRLWFRAYRALPDFTLIRALEQMTQWSLVSDEIDAKYYLYILHFIAAREGVPRSGQEARRYLELCRRQAPVLQSKKSFEWWAASELHRPCPLVHHSELGHWSKESDFFEGISKLGFVEGRIDEIKSPQSGVIDISGVPAFFVPRTEFYRGRDLNAPVNCHLGFSYEGLRAWNVRRPTP